MKLPFVLVAVCAMLLWGSTAAEGSDLSSYETIHGFYPRALHVRSGHRSTQANGTILAATNDGRFGYIFSSSDQKQSFEQISVVDFGIGGSSEAVGLCCIALFETSAGDLLFAGSVTLRNGSHMLPILRSRDGGVRWQNLSTLEASAPHGLWEPHFHYGADGSTLIGMYSDETNYPGQMLMMKSSMDNGAHWGPAKPFAVWRNPKARPGMVTVARVGLSFFVATFEVCGGVILPDCGVRYRTSADGIDWGDVADPGHSIVVESFLEFAHTPNVFWTPLGGQFGTTIVIGQMIRNAVSGAAISALSGRLIFYSNDFSANSSGIWKPLGSPVAVNDPKNDWCQNYSPWMILMPTPSQGIQILELTTDWIDGHEKKGCHTLYASAVHLGGP